MNPDHWKEEKYREVYEQTVAAVRLRKEHDPGFGKKALRRLLDNAFISAGNDWVGRGPVAQIVDDAVIAAYDHCLAEWDRIDDLARTLAHEKNR